MPIVSARGLKALFPVLFGLALLFSFISISCTQALLGLAFIAWLAGLVRKDWKGRLPAFFWPLIGYAAWSLLAAALSVTPELSFMDSRDMLLFLIVPMAVLGLTAAADLALAARAVLVSAAAFVRSGPPASFGHPEAPRSREAASPTGTVQPPGPKPIEIPKEDPGPLFRCWATR